jgi:hypothetical protein
MRTSLILLLLAEAVSVLADTIQINGTDSNSTAGDDGLGGGAIAGIVIGSLAGVSLVGAFALYWFRVETPFPFPKRPPALTTAGPASTGRKLGENHLPMMAMRVNHDDDI